MSGTLHEDLSVCRIVGSETCTSTVQREDSAAFTWQQWLRKLVTVLRYTFIAYFVSTSRRFGETRWSKWVNGSYTIKKVMILISQFY
jgi:hypothetical protein